MPIETKRIWVVADDYGIARGVNAAPANAAELRRNEFVKLAGYAATSA